MEPISTFLTLALGYILKGAATSKTSETAKESLLGAFWQWVKPVFLVEVPDVEDKTDSEETEEKVKNKLMEKIKDEEWFNELVKRVSELQKAGIKEKNIVRGNIINVKKIRIGDKEYTPNEVYTAKNIVEGNVENADEFTLGDGH